MKYRMMFIFGMIFLTVNGVAQSHGIKMSRNLKPYITFHDEARIYLRRDNVVIRTRDAEDGKVLITDDYALIVNGKKIMVNDTLQIKIGQYHGLIIRVMEDVKKISWEGARLGINGAVIGVKAVAGVFRMILPNYGPDDLEADMERESERIEAKAEKLEARAEILEEMLMEIEALHETLREFVPELNALEWF